MVIICEFFAPRMEEVMIHLYVTSLRFEVKTLELEKERVGKTPHFLTKNILKVFLF